MLYIKSGLKKYADFYISTIMKNLEDPERDKTISIRPVIIILLKRFQTIPVGKKVSLDEQICPTKAHIHIKQYMPAKPRKWGYKIFVLSAIDGFPIILKFT